jgi:predicted ATPase
MKREGERQMRPFSAITVSNYRSFAKPFRLELRPITLLYGHNNTGKSALIRLLALIADSIRADSGAALDLSGPAGRGATFSDVLWRGNEDPDLALTFHCAESTEVERAEYVIAFSREHHTVYVKRLQVFRASDDPSPIALEAVPLASGGFEYAVRGADVDGPVTFAGLLPTLAGDDSVGYSWRSQKAPCGLTPSAPTG